MPSPTLLLLAALALSSAPKPAASPPPEIRALAKHVWSGSHPLYRSTPWRTPPTGFTLTSREIDPVTGQWHTWSFTCPTDYKVTSVDARHANELYVSGTSKTGQTIIERWLIPPQVGAFHTPLAKAGPFGVSLPVTRPKLVIQGGTWLLPKARVLQAAPHKERLLETSAIGPIRELLVDPDGRFVLAIECASNSVFQVNTLNPTKPILLADASQDELLANLKFNFAHIFEDGCGGRLYAINKEVPNSIGLMLFDPNNDGIFETPFWLSEIAQEALFPGY